MRVLNSTTIEWRDVSPLIFPDRLERFEKIYGVSLPEEFKVVVKENNGGSPVPNGIRAETGEEFKVGAFLSFNQEDKYNLYKLMDNFVRCGYTKLIPFAMGPRGSCFCFWDKRIVLFTKDKDVVRICNNFDVFIGGLRELTEV